MKKPILTICTAVTACLLTGCETTGLSQREHAGITYPNYILGLQSARTGSPMPAPTLPLRLAVAQIGESAPPQSMLDQLQTQSTLIASVMALPLPGEEPAYHREARDLEQQSVVFSNRVHSICQLAQAAGADYIFIFGGGIDSSQTSTSSSILDFTLIGSAVVPSRKIRMEGRAAGVLVATATSRAVFFVNADAKCSGLAPSLAAESKTVSLQTTLRDQLTESLSAAFLKKLAESPISRNISG